MAGLGGVKTKRKSMISVLTNLSTPNGTRFCGAARAARFLKRFIFHLSPDSLRRAATKVSAIVSTQVVMFGAFK